jgi:hypothetical protein
MLVLSSSVNSWPLESLAVAAAAAAAAAASFAGGSCARSAACFGLGAVSTVGRCLLFLLENTRTANAQQGNH